MKYLIKLWHISCYSMVQLTVSKSLKSKNVIFDFDLRSTKIKKNHSEELKVKNQ